MDDAEVKRPRPRRSPKNAACLLMVCSLVVQCIFLFSYSGIMKYGSTVENASWRDSLLLRPQSHGGRSVASMAAGDRTNASEAIDVKKGEEEEEEAKWTTIGTLGVVLERIAVNKTVIICTVNAGYWDLFLNFLVSLHKVGLADRLLVYAGDFSTYHFLEKHWPGHAVLFRYPGATSRDRMTTSMQAHGLGGKEFGEIVFRRPSQILACLEHGYSVLYSDIDSVFVKDPFPYMVGAFDGYFGWDAYVHEPYMNGSDRLPTQEEAQGLNICSCLLFFRPTQQSMEVMQRWYSNMRVSRARNDQPVLNGVLDGIRSGNDTSFSFMILPQKNFQSGGILRDQEAKWRSMGGDPVILHANFFFGTANKIKTFKRFNSWYLEESENGTVEWPSALLQTITH